MLGSIGAHACTLKITPIRKEYFAIVVSRPTTCFSETIFHIEPCSICQLLRVIASLPQKEAICSLWFRMAAWLKKGLKGGIIQIGIGQGGSGCSGKLAPCMCKDTHCTCASSPCIFFFASPSQMCSPKQGENFIFEKNSNFLSFMVLLYVPGHFKQKKF